MADETRNVTTIYTIKNDPKNAATIRQTQRIVEKAREDRVKDEDKAVARELQLRKRESDTNIRFAKQDYDTRRRIATAFWNDKVRESERAVNRELQLRQREANENIRFAKRQADAEIKETARAEREKGLLRNRSGFVGALFSSQRSNLGAIGSQMRMLPSVPIPGTGMGTDQVANMIRISGAAGQMGLGSGLAAVGGLVGGGAIAGGSLLAGGAVTAIAAGAAVELWTERLKGSTDAVGSFTRKVGNFLAGTNFGPSMGAPGTPQNVNYKQDRLKEFDRRYLERSQPSNPLLPQYEKLTDLPRAEYKEYQKKREELSRDINLEQLERNRNNLFAFRESQHNISQIDEGAANETFQNRRERSIFSAGSGKRGTAKELAENSAAIAATKTYYASQKTKAGNDNNLEDQIAAFERLKEASKDLERLTKERYDIEKRNSQEVLELKKQELAASRQLLSEAKSELSSVRSQLGSNAEKFLSSDPFERSQMIAAARKAQGGQQLNYRDAEALRGLSGDVFADARTKSTLEELKRFPGAEAILPKDLVNRESELKKQINDLKITIKNEGEIIVKIQNDGKASEAAISDAFGKELVKILDERDKQIEEARKAAQRAAIDQALRAQNRGAGAAN